MCKANRFLWVPLVFLLVGHGSAQVMYEPFVVVGSPISGWTPSTGIWKVVDVGGNDLRAESPSSGHSYLIKDKSLASIGCIEATATGVTNTCNGGVMLRWDSGRQDGIRAYGASSGGMNSYKILIVSAPGVTRVSVSLANRTRNLKVRIIAQGTDVRGQFDVDPLDGVWDHELDLTVISTTGTPYGGYAWNGSYLDDIKFFDAVMFRRIPFGSSNIGKTVPLDLYAPTAGAPYVLVPSLLKGMIMLPNAWFSPVVPDDITVAAPHLPTIFGRFSGTLDGNGKATANLNVPGNGALAGITVYIAGVVLDNKPTPSILHLFNDERIDLKP